MHTRAMDPLWVFYGFSGGAHVGFRSSCAVGLFVHYICIERDVRSNMATASSRNTEPSTCVHELYRSFCVSVMGCALFVHPDVDTDTF